MTQDIADKLELVLGVPSHIWVNLEARYQRTLEVKRERDATKARRSVEVSVSS